MITYRTRTGQDAYLWQQRLEEQLRLRWEQIQAVLDAHLFPPETEAVGDANLIFGLGWDSDAPPPSGWRYHRCRVGVLVPDQSTAHGQAAAQDLGAITHGNGALLLPGDMPSSARIDGRLALPQVQRENEYLWVHWPRPLPDEVPVDPQVWERL